MTVLIRCSIGKQKYRLCTAGCYNARHKHCVCICGGVNHGIGFDKARQNTEGVVQVLLNQHSIKGIQAKLPVIQEVFPIEAHQAGA